MKNNCKLCWYIISAVLLVALLAVNIVLFQKQSKYVNFEMAKAGWKSNWNMIEQIYKTNTWSEQQAESIDYTIEQFRAQYKDTSDNTNTDNSNADVTAMVENLLATAPVRGDKDARFTIIEYTELLCPYCQRHSVNWTIESVMDQFPWEVNSVSRHFIIHGQTALELAAAMECVAELKPDVYYDVFAKAFEAYPVDMDNLKTIATNAGVKKADLEKCIDEWRYTQSVQDMMNQWATVFGISGTPGNVIFDRETGKYQVLPWAYPAENFVSIIESMK